MATAEQILSRSAPTRVVRSGGTASGRGDSQTYNPFQSQRDINDQYRNTQLPNDFSQLNKEREREEKQLQTIHGFTYENWAKSDVDRFSEHRDVLSERVTGGYYDEESGNGGYSKFLQDLEGLNNSYDSFTPSEAMIQQRSDLQQSILEGGGNYDNNFELVDTYETFAQKEGIFDTGGVKNVEFDSQTMQHVGTYIDMEGNPILGEDGKEIRGPIGEAPMRGSRELFFPTLKERGGMDPSDIAATFSESVYQKVYAGPGGAGADLDKTLEQVRSQIIEKLSNIDSLPPNDPYRNALVTANNQFGDRNAIEPAEGVEAQNSITEYADKVVQSVREMTENKSQHSDEMFWNDQTGDLNPSNTDEEEQEEP